MRRKKNLQKLLNLQYLKVTNKTLSVGRKDLPKLYCDIDIYPDFIALYDEPGLYHKTDKTCVAFFKYDDVFNGRFGLAEAIRWDDQARQQFFRNRFEGVRYMCSPDNTIAHDLQKFEIDYRLAQSREVSIWLTMNVNTTVIPLITYTCVNDFRFMLDGLEDVSVVMFNTKGKIEEGIDNYLLLLAIKFTVKHLKKLKAIVVYSTSSDDSKVLEMFKSALDVGIQVIIPENTLRSRNYRLTKEKKNECA